MKFFQIITTASILLLSFRTFGNETPKNAQNQNQTVAYDSVKTQMDQMQLETEALPAPDQSQLVSSVEERLQSLCIATPEKVPDKTISAQ